MPTSQGLKTPKTLPLLTGFLEKAEIFIPARVLDRAFHDQLTGAFSAGHVSAVHVAGKSQGREKCPGNSIP